MGYIALPSKRVSFSFLFLFWYLFFTWRGWIIWFIFGNISFPKYWRWLLTGHHRAGNTLRGRSPVSVRRNNGHAISWPPGWRGFEFVFLQHFWFEVDGDASACAIGTSMGDSRRGWAPFFRLSIHQKRDTCCMTALTESNIPLVFDFVKIMTLPDIGQTARCRATDRPYTKRSAHSKIDAFKGSSRGNR